MTLVVSQQQPNRTILEGMSMDEYAKQSNYRRAVVQAVNDNDNNNNANNNHNRRSSIGCTSELRPSTAEQSSSPQHQSWHKPESSNDTEECDELSECSTIMSSMEMSSSSLLSKDKSNKSNKSGKSKRSARRHSMESGILHFENDGECSPNEDEKSGRAYKDSIFHQYYTAYISPVPSPAGKSLKQQLRFTDAISPAPLSPQHQRPNNSCIASNNNGLGEETMANGDRRKMFSRWASTGHMCPTDDECESADKATRDKPPTSPVRRARAAKVTIPASVPSTLPLAGEHGSAENAAVKPVSLDKAPKSPARPSTTTRRDHFARCASTGVMVNKKSKPVVQLHQEKQTFETPASPHKKNDKAPICPDRRRQYRRRNSTGSSDSLEDMLICLTDDEASDEMNTFVELKQRKSSSSSKRKNRRASAAGDGSCSTSSRSKVTADSSHTKTSSSSIKKKSKKKEKSSSKDKKDKSSKKKSSSKSPETSPVKKSTDPRDCLQNESLFSLLGKSTSTILAQTKNVFQAPEADPKPASRPYRTFSRCASTGILAGDGMIMMAPATSSSTTNKVKHGGTTTMATMDNVPFASPKRVEKLRSIFEQNA